MNGKVLWKKMIEFGPIALVVIIGLIKEFARLGLWHVTGFRWQLLIMYGLFILGAVAGYLLVDLDDLLKKRKFKSEQMDSVLSQWKKSVHTVLTAAVIAVCGLWVISSSSSALSWGLVLALQLRLFSELLFATDYSEWYGVISRKVSLAEHRIFLLVWGIVLLVQWLILVIN